MKRLAAFVVVAAVFAGCGPAYRTQVNRACAPPHGGVVNIRPTNNPWVHRLFCRDGTVEAASE